MDIHSEFMEPVTPGLSYENVHYWKTEDSGYRSYTPGSLECSEISSDNFNSTLFNGKIGFTRQFQVGCYDIQSHVSFRPTLKFSAEIIRPKESYTESPQCRRGTKRQYQEDSKNTDISHGSLPTPTSLISGGLRKLKFSETRKLNSSLSSVSCNHSDNISKDLFSENDNVHTAFPTTPIKKVCRSSCKLSSPLNSKKPAKRLDFVMHSLSCDSQALQPLVKPEVSTVKTNKSYQFRPNQKIDIIKMLYADARAMPPVMKIFDYLSHKDIYNVTLVSPQWQKIWKYVSKVKSEKRQDFLHYSKNVQENQENKMSTPKKNDSNPNKPLMEIKNVLKNQNMIINTTSTPISPPGTPKTIKFKRFARAASLDLRKQMSCVRCQQPAKVTEESSEDEWVECTSVNCSYQFCRFCKCERHPGKSCILYDLDGPSPSKRKKSVCAVGTKKSRKNLRRLL